MGNDSWPRGTLLVGLSGGSAMAGEIDKVMQLVRERDDLNVVMDLSRVGAPNSGCMADLLRLRKLLRANRRRLILSNVGAATEAILSVSGLDAVFEIVRDRLDALATIRTRPDNKPGHLTPGGSSGEPLLSEVASISR